MSELILETEAARSASSSRPVRLCSRADLVAGSGIVAWHDGHQIALFYLPCRPEAADGADELEIYALDNRDPFSGANVIGRGIIGDLKGELVVASPIYKQHFRLRDGQCLEDADQRLRHWPVAFDGDDVVLLGEDSTDRG